MRIFSRCHSMNDQPKVCPPFPSIEAGEKVPFCHHSAMRPPQIFLSQSITTFEVERGRVERKSRENMHLERSECKFHRGHCSGENCLDMTGSVRQGGRQVNRPPSVSFFRSIDFTRRKIFVKGHRTPTFLVVVNPHAGIFFH